jgi:hypothetical protein
LDRNERSPLKEQIEALNFALWDNRTLVCDRSKPGEAKLSTETEIITQPFKKIQGLQQISPIEKQAFTGKIPPQTLRGCVIIYSHPLITAPRIAATTQRRNTSL